MRRVDVELLAQRRAHGAEAAEGRCIARLVGEEGVAIGRAGEMVGRAVVGRTEGGVALHRTVLGLVGDGVMAVQDHAGVDIDGAGGVLVVGESRCGGEAEGEGGGEKARLEEAVHGVESLGLGLGTRTSRIRPSLSSTGPWRSARAPGRLRSSKCRTAFMLRPPAGPGRPGSRPAFRPGGWRSSSAC